MSEDELTPEERAALDAWTVPALAPNLADRVLAAQPAEEAPEPMTIPKRRRWVALAVGAAAVAATALLTDQSSSGQLAAQAVRQTAMIGDRATIVAEAGSEVSWKVGRRGDAVVRQDRGNVFYRVERGGLFKVAVGDVDVRVLGTSFRVEVLDMKSKNAALIGAGVGALVATTVVVTVYEGRVVSASPAGKMELAAGEAVVFAPKRSPKKIEGALSSAAARGDGAPSAMAAAAAPAIDTSNESPSEMKRHLAWARAENERLEARLAEVEQTLAEAPKAARRTYDLDEATLSKLADECRLAWDTVSLGVEPPTLPDTAIAKLGIAEGERAVVDANFAKSQAELIATIRETYTAVTGDAQTGSLATEAMLVEINDKTDREVMKRIFSRLSSERAGRVPPPEDLSKASPVERMYRMMTTAGDRLEDAIAADLGPEQARKIRDSNQGWNSQHRSSYGCP